MCYRNLPWRQFQEDGINLLCVYNLQDWNSYHADCKQSDSIYVVPFVTHTRTKETKPAIVRQVRGNVISSSIFCDTKMALPYCVLGYHSPVFINKDDQEGGRSS